MDSNLLARSLQNGARCKKIDFQYIQPGKLTQNAFIERFNGIYRRGVLNMYIFEDLNQAREETETWMEDYNNVSPIMHWKNGFRNIT